jgi:dihydrodipicolinate synthase/N-acetylneuraminate lyase
MIDMGELPPMDLIQELLILAEKIKRKANPEAFKEVSDLVSMLVAASVREPLQMLHEIVIRDQNEQLSKELDELLAGSAYLDQEHKELEP